MSKIRTLIVDDEDAPRNRLQRFLSSDPDIKIIGLCPGGREAISAVEHLSPDLLLLDIVMPGVNGFEVIDAIVEQDLRMPKIIFVTGYKSFAIKAFEVNAVDYLEKIVDPDRLKIALQKVKQARTLEQDYERIKAAIAEINPPSRYATKLWVREIQEGDSCLLPLPVTDIIWIEGDDNRALIHTKNSVYSWRKGTKPITTLRTERLNPNQFKRIHKSHIINVDYIKQLWLSEQTVVLRVPGSNEDKILNISGGYDTLKDL